MSCWVSTVPASSMPYLEARNEIWRPEMNSVFTAACIKFTSARDYEPNIRVVSDLVWRARDADADFVMTPENTGLTEPNGKLRREKACDEANHPVFAALCEVAKET